MINVLKIIFLIGIIIIFHCKSCSQVEGIVVDSETGSPLENVQILIDSVFLAYSNTNGKFIINPAKKQFNINVLYIGYYPLIIKSDSSLRFIHLRLIPNPGQLPEVMVSSTNIGQRLKSADGSLSILTLKHLETGSDSNIADYINQLPGVFMQSGTSNTNRITIRGIGSRTPYSSNRIRSFFDEIPLTSGDGITTIEDIDMADIGRIEIIKGPSSTLYGSGLGGVLRILPFNSSSSKFSIECGSEIGSFGSQKYILKSGLNHKKSSASILFSHFEKDGFRQNNRYKRNSCLLTGNSYFSAFRIRYIINYIDLNAQIPSSLNKTDFDNSPNLAAANWLSIKGFEKYKKLLSGFTISHSVKSNLLHTLNLYSTFANSYESRPFNILEDGSINAGFKDKWQLDFTFLKTQAGVEYFNEWYQWQIYETLSGNKGLLSQSNKENRHFWNLFFLNEYQRFSKLKLSIGANLHFLSYKLIDRFQSDSIDQSGNYSYKPILSPRIGLNYALSKKMNFFASAGHGFSAPSLEETLLPQGIININLKPEEGYNLELGFRSVLFDNHLFIELDYYWIFLRNLLVTKRFSEDTFTGINAGKTNHHGLELQLDYHMFTNDDQKNSFDISVAYYQSQNVFRTFVDDGQDFTGKQLPGIPDKTFSSNCNLKVMRRLNINMHYQYAGSQFLNDKNSGSIDSYHHLNLKAGCLLKINKDTKVDLYAGVKNLLNQNYASMIVVNAQAVGKNLPRYFYPGEPRNYYLGIKINFQSN